MQRWSRGRGGVRGGARRGATLVLTTVLLTALILMTAASIDLGRLFTLKNELQTAADAAALAGAKALVMQEGSVQARASAVAAENHAIAPAVKVESVGYGVWDNQTHTLVPVASPSSADAVTVTVRGASTGLLSPLVQRFAPAVSATATAWATAPLEAVTHCAKPWAMYYGDVMQKLGKGPNDKLTGRDVAQMADTVDGKVYIYLHFGDADLAPGNFGSVALGGRRGGAAYENNIVACNTVHVGDVVETEPGKKVGPTEKGIEQLCHVSAPGPCYDDDGHVGVPVTIPVYTSFPSGGRTDVQIKFIATVVITSFDSGANVRGFLFAMNESGFVDAGPDRGTTSFRTMLVQ